MSLNKAILQLAGVASVIDVDRIRDITDEFKTLRSLLIRHDQVLFAQSQQSAACNASHSVEARMCCWLLRMRDLAGGDDLTLTQEFLAQMMGVRRPSVSLVANTLQKAGFIKYSRGHKMLFALWGQISGEVASLFDQAPTKRELSDACDSKPQSFPQKTARSLTKWGLVSPENRTRCPPIRSNWACKYG
jgi:hypothetical protein